MECPTNIRSTKYAWSYRMQSRHWMVKTCRRQWTWQLRLEVSKKGSFWCKIARLKKVDREWSIFWKFYILLQIATLKCKIAMNTSSPEGSLFSPPSLEPPSPRRTFPSPSAWCRRDGCCWSLLRSPGSPFPPGKPGCGTRWGHLCLAGELPGSVRTTALAHHIKIICEIT